MKKMKILALVLGVIMLFSITACANTESTTSASVESAQNATASEAPDEVKEAVEKVAESGDLNYEDLKVFVALGWMENESGWRTRDGYEQTLLSYGIPEENITFTDANYDVGVQVDQLHAAIETDPDVIFCMPASAEGLAEAVQDVVDADIPIFLNDGPVVGAEDIVTGWCIGDDYSKGYTTMTYLCEQLGGKGNVALIKLDPNANWKLRSDAAKDVAAQYPDINIVAEWSWDSTGVNTPRMAMDGFLSQFPNEGELDAVWCAWDTAVMECLGACDAAGRDDIIFVGDNVGVQEVVDTIRDNPQFIGSVGSGFYYQAMTNVNNAMSYLAGEDMGDMRVYTNDIFFDAQIIKDAEAKMEEGESLLDYDLPGNMERWGLKPIEHHTPPETSEAYGKVR